MPDEPTAKLARLMGTAKTPAELRTLLDDLLTPTEQHDLCERWEIARRLLLGVPQRQIKDDLGVSISLVTRASHVLKNQGAGFRRAAARLATKKH